MAGGVHGIIPPRIGGGLRTFVLLGAGGFVWVSDGVIPDAEPAVVVDLEVAQHGVALYVPETMQTRSSTTPTSTLARSPTFSLALLEPLQDSSPNCSSTFGPAPEVKRNSSAASLSG